MSRAFVREDQPHVRQLLERAEQLLEREEQLPEMQRDDRLVRLARRFLKAR